MKLLQKMGWKPGQVIGKRGEGYAEPIALTVKIDRKGLSTGKEKATKKGAPAMLDLQGMVVQEICFFVVIVVIYFKQRAIFSVYIASSKHKERFREFKTVMQTLDCILCLHHF